MSSKQKPVVASTKSAAAAKSSAKVSPKVAPVAVEDEDQDQTTEQSTELVIVPKNALQVDLGAELLSDLSTDVEKGDQIKSLTGERGQLKRAARSKAALGVSQVMENDPDFNATDAYAAESKWRKAIARLYVAFGIKNADGTYTADALRFFPDPNASDAAKETADFKRRKSLRDNFGTLIKKATKIALAAQENSIGLAFNDEKQTLRLTNAPASFAGKTGMVDLTGEQISGAKDRASFENLIALADRKHDPKYAEKVANQKGGTSNVEALAHNAATSEKDLGALCNAVIAAVNAMDGNITGGQRKVLQNLWDKVDHFLETAKDV